MLDQVLGQLKGEIAALTTRVARLESQEARKAYGSFASRPGSPFTGQRYFATDRGIEYYYDGTRWLSSDPIFLPLIPRDTQLFTQAAHTLDLIPARYDINGWYAERLLWYFFSATAQSGVNYYTLTNTTVGGGTAPTLAGTTDTKTFTPGNVVYPIINTFSGNQVQGSGISLYQVTMTPTAAAGIFNFGAVLQFRLIG